MKNAPSPNAARLLHTWMFSQEAQQMNVDIGGLRTAHPLVTDKPGRVPLKDIKTMKEDAAAVESQAEEIKTRYTQLFKV